MDQPVAIVITAAVELVVLSMVAALYYYEAIRGEIQGTSALSRKAERMFALSSALLVPALLALGLLLWFPHLEPIVWLSRAIVTVLLLIIAGCCTCWALGGLVDSRWYFIPWKRGNRDSSPEARGQRSEVSKSDF
jgi:hypothetical protein